MTNSPQYTRSPLSLLLLLILMSMGMYILSPVAFMAAGVEVLGISLNDFMRKIGMEEPEPSIQLTLVLVQASAAILSFIIVPAYFIKKHEFSSLNKYFHSQSITTNAILITLGLTLSLMVINSLLIEWNMSIEFPDALASTFDQWEEQGRLMTDYLTDFYSLPYFLLVMIVVAVVPAIGEELLFRGLIQKYLQKIWGNPQVAIWMTAFFFSAFHLQFYGFFPRMVLGAFFGYMLYFSGNLWYPVIAHFVNNGFTLLMMYLFQQGIVGYDIDSTDSLSIWPSIIFLIIGGFLFVLFKKQFHITDNLQNE